MSGLYVFNLLLTPPSTYLNTLWELNDSWWHQVAGKASTEWRWRLIPNSASHFTKSPRQYAAWFHKVLASERTEESTFSSFILMTLLTKEVTVWWYQGHSQGHQLPGKLHMFILCLRSKPLSSSSSLLEDSMRQHTLFGHVTIIFTCGFSHSTETKKESRKGGIQDCFLCGSVWAGLSVPLGPTPAVCLADHSLVVT